MKKGITDGERRVLQTANKELYASEIALEAHVDIQTVYRTVRKFKLEIKKYKKELTEYQKGMIREMASPTTGAKVIIEKVGCTRFQAEEFMDAEGLPRKRSKSLRKVLPMSENGIFNVDSVGRHNTWLV